VGKSALKAHWIMVINTMYKCLHRLDGTKEQSWGCISKRFLKQKKFMVRLVQAM